MNSPIETSVERDFARQPEVARRDRRRKWKMFWAGLAIRLLGLTLIWFGDGSDSVARKALVVVGVILSIGGITLLRYLLISGFRRKR